MRLRVHHPLFAGFLGVTGALLFMVLLVTDSGLRRGLEELNREDLGRQLNLAAALVEASPDLDPDGLARLITERLGNRVTLVRLDGVVLGDSYVEPERVAEMENHRDRSEILGVLAGEGISFATRTSATVGARLLYGARMATLDGTPIVLRIAAPLDDIESAIGDVRNLVVATGLLAMVAALIVAYLLSRAFTRPLLTLVDRAGRLARGDFTTRAPSSRVVELQDLGAAFNRLTEELQARLAELGRERDEMQTLIDCMAEGVVALTPDARLMRTNRAARALLGIGRTPDLPEPRDLAPVGAVIRDPTLREALERSVTEPAQSGEIRIGGRTVLLASRALDHGGAVTTLLDITELRRLEQVRRDFVANASHELKTPLTSIRGYAETLAEDDPPEAVRKRFLESIRSNTLRLQRLVDDLLDLSRLEAGGWSAASDRIALRDLVREAWELVSNGEEVDRRFTVEGEAEAIGDRQGLVQVFRNLLENSVRHTRPGGRIRVSIEDAAPAGFVHVSVSDDGEGIPVRALPRIFERFFRADPSRDRELGGTGLGLSIVKHLVSAMRGRIYAESQLGKGTTVHFTIPSAGS